MCLDDKLQMASLTVPVPGRRIGLRMIAHQLNNTLVPILTLGSLLAESLQQGEATRDLDLMVASAIRARELVRLLISEVDRLETATIPQPGDTAGTVLPFRDRSPA
jgi:hypothetical protein